MKTIYKKFTVVILFFIVGALVFINLKYKNLRLVSSNISAKNISDIGNINKEKDVYLLASVINNEAMGENYTGQVAVGAVILNRVNDPSFPDTISGVIYQADEFASVTDNLISTAPDKTSINAARDALSGWDPTNGSLYFWNPQTAASRWMLSIPVTKVIGHHAFGTR